MFLDLDEFKAVNDHYGHATGDELLKQVSDRLQEAVRESDTVARIGGDEFTIVLEGSQRVEDAGHVATKILRALEVPYEIGGRTLHITASIGIALYPIDGEDADGLLRDADIAMYSAKSAGRNTYQYFTPELREQTSERLFLIDGLRRALDTGERAQPALSAIRRHGHGQSPRGRGVWLGGIILSSDSCTPTALCLWPKRPTSSFRWASGCSTRRVVS